MPRFKDQAICIRHFPWSETSQVVALFTEEHGKVRGLAKGSKRTSPGAVARFCGGIELLTLGQAVGVIKQSTDLATLTEWDLQNPYFHLRADLASQRAAMYAVDLANAFLADLDPHPRTFGALRQLLEDLKEPIAPLLASYQWLLLEDSGFQPELDHDVESGRPLGASRTYLFDPHAGGFTTSPTAANHSRLWRVRGETLQTLRQAAQSATLPAAPPTDRANRLLCSYARTVVGKHLPTMDFVLGPHRASHSHPK